MKKFQPILYLILILITILDILMLGYVTFYPVPMDFRHNVFTFDLLLCVVMWIEFIYNFLKSDKKQYMKDNWLSIFGMLPTDFVFLRALRLIKLIQLIKLFVLEVYNENTIPRFLKETLLDKILLITVIFTSLMTILIVTFDSKIDNIPDAFWYIIVSMTSTGYGDIVPTTISGHVIGAIAMIGGILIFATVTAVISSQYISRINKNHRNELEEKIENLTCEIEKLNRKIDELKKD